MDITVALAFDEKAALRLLNWLAKENMREIKVYDRRARQRPGTQSLPGLYESGVRYEVEKVELWSDYINTLTQGFEDCDALAAARAGELMARGWRALKPRSQRDPVRYPGDGGYRTAMLTKPRSIRAEVMLTTDGEPGKPGLYHCIVRYWVGGREYRDDPSVRLGMLTGNSAEEQAGLVQGMAGASVRETFGGRNTYTVVAMRDGNVMRTFSREGRSAAENLAWDVAGAGNVDRAVVISPEARSIFKVSNYEARKRAGFGARSPTSHCIARKMTAEGWPQERAVAACLNMDERGRLGPRGGYRRVR